MPANGNQQKPYDFSDWQIGADAYSDIEIAAWNLIAEAQDQESVPADWPDLKQLLEAVADLVRRQIAAAFDSHRSGGWTILKSDDARLRWLSEIEPIDEPASIELSPRQIVPLLLAPLAARLGDFPEPDKDLDEENDEEDEFDWDETWGQTFRAAKEWQRAIQATLRGLRAMREERRERLWELLADKNEDIEDGR